MAAPKQEERKLTPHFKWCQDMDRLLIKLEVSNAKIDETKLDITRDAFSFEYKNYSLKFSFRFPVNPKTIKYRATRILELIIEKETSNAYWPHLLPKPEKKKFKNHCQVDWDRFLDEEEAEKRQKGVVEDDDEYGNLSNMGMGGDDEDSSSDDSDDKPIDDLELKPEDQKEAQVEVNNDDVAEQPIKKEEEVTSNNVEEAEVNNDKTKTEADEEDQDKDDNKAKPKETVDDTTKEQEAAQDATAEEIDID